MQLHPNIGGAVYINLDRRTDRRDQFESEMERLGIQVERFSAIETPGIGILGCGKSHLAVLKLARDRNWSSVLIFEDDWECIVSPVEFHESLTKFMELGCPWDVLMLSYHINQSVPHNDIVCKVLDAQTASGYIVHQTFYQTLIDLYETAMVTLEQTRAHWIYANDQIWKQLQPTANWYAFVTRIGRQRPGYSDNAQDHVNYVV